MIRHEYLVIGAGPGGLCSGIKLKESGREDFVILEKAAGVGGTWYHNRYPGAACDVPSHLYSFSFDCRLDWPRPFSPQAEILTYLEQCAEKHGLLPHIRLETEVAKAEWIDSESAWRVTTESGEIYEARILLSALGMFNELNYPDIPGLDAFEGTRFHSARWREDHDVTGERVAVIGSAASAVQFVPEIAKRADQVDLYQRTANWVLPKADTPFSQEQIDIFRNQPELVYEMRREIYKEIEPVLTFDNDELLAASDQAGRDAISEVEDPETRRKLTPDHPYGCKRPLLSNNFYSTFNRPNVELVTDSIERIDPKGVVTADGKLREVDTLILATGFDTTRYLSAIDVTGREGARLEEAWSEGAYAFLGTMVPHFPNLFMMYGPNTNNGSILEMIEHQVAFAIRQIERIETEGLAWLEATPAATEAYNDAIQKDIDGVDVWQANCLGYYKSPSGRIVTQWPHNMGEYERRMNAVDASAFESAAR
ncbi:MAG: NAD(P)/FAD-dependent oxidoreductase [bacterium]|nr:4-hydroxyacetophenone monooxygenase [Deltaproteobacteria bacterium]MCP4907923.1 NAD(P)/FAD-dependent oxidoreductase [bacterium]